MGNVGSELHNNYGELVLQKLISQEETRITFLSESEVSMSC